MSTMYALIRDDGESFELGKGGWLSEHVFGGDETFGLHHMYESPRFFMEDMEPIEQRIRHAWRYWEEKRWDCEYSERELTVATRIRDWASGHVIVCVSEHDDRWVDSLDKETGSVYDESYDAEGNYIPQEGK